ncbi:MAG: type III pantothenate kinase, partial [Bacteroidota bacterium]
MILTVDIGNTDMVFGVASGGDWIHQFRHPTREYANLNQHLVDEFRIMNVEFEEIRRAILSSVVPGDSPVVERLLRDHLGERLEVLGPGLYERLPVKVLNPFEIGADLVANSIAAFSLVRQACIVVDFGTALTFSTINESGEIEGVAIAPGLKTAMKSLFMNAAQLPEVPLDWPDSAIGKGTAHALQAGILKGYVGLVRELIHQIRLEKKKSEMPVIATG